VTAALADAAPCSYELAWAIPAKAAEYGGKHAARQCADAVSAHRRSPGKRSERDMIKFFVPIFAFVVIILFCIRLFRPSFGTKKSIIFLLGGAGVAYILSYVAVFLMFVYIGLLHVEAYSPDAAHFDDFLARDTQAYFSKRQGRPVTVRYEYLRQGPTQSGIGFPRYYIWVQIFADGREINAGAVKVAGVGKDRFEITDFLSRGMILDVPGRLDAVFPKAVCETIKSRLRL